MNVVPQSTPAAASASLPTVAPAMTAAAQRFEAVFLRTLIAAMRKGRLADDVIGSTASDQFREMADAQTADALARRGVFGIAALIEQQLGAPHE